MWRSFTRFREQIKLLDFMQTKQGARNITSLHSTYSKLHFEIFAPPVGRDVTEGK